jgi:hypothetical protein
MPPEHLSMYISRVADLPPSLADVAFADRVRRADGHLAVPSGTFRVDAVLPRPQPCTNTLLPLQRVRGRLQRGGLGVSIPVELELTPWSNARTDVGLRYMGRRIPGGRARSRYFAIGSEVVELLVAALEVWLAHAHAAAPGTRAA